MIFNALISKHCKDMEGKNTFFSGLKRLRIANFVIIQVFSNDMFKCMNEALNN